MRVHFLGTGDSVSASGKHQAGYLVTTRQSGVLLDCGAMVLASMKRDGIDPDSIDAIVISHLHGDHFGGLPFLFIEYTYDRPRQRPLVIAGPPGVAERVHGLYSASYREMATRPLPFELRYVAMMPDTTHGFGDLSVSTFLVPHQDREISLGLLVEGEERRVLYSGDTGWTETLVEKSQGTDLFICECCYYETRLPFHLDYPRLAMEHRRFGCKRLVLTHLGREVLAHRDELKLEIAADGMVIEL